MCIQLSFYRPSKSPAVVLMAGQLSIQLVVPNMQPVLSVNSSVARAEVGWLFNPGKALSTNKARSITALVARQTVAAKCRTIKASGCGCQTATTQKIRIFDVSDFDFDLTSLLAEGDKIARCEARTNQGNGLACLAVGKVAKAWVNVQTKKEDRFTLQAESEYGVRKEFLVILRVE